MGNSIFPKYVLTSDGKKAVRCVNWLEVTDGKIPSTIHYQINKGYLYDGMVWIYAGNNKPDNADQYPYFWGESGGKIHFSEPSVETMEAFKEENLKDVSLNIINETIQPGEVLYNEQEIDDLNDAHDVYIPIIKDKDDFLKKIIKKAIIDKGIDLARLKYLTGEKYVLPNMKAALENNTKMSVMYFAHWCELLGLDFSVMVYDNGRDTQDPLKFPIIYRSDDGSLAEVKN